jgi:hypothetical protein
MKKYVDHRIVGDAKHRIEVAQIACNNIYELPEAIERSKMEVRFTKSSIPAGYDKTDELLITTVYEIPQEEVMYTSYNNFNSTQENTENKKHISKYKKVYRQSDYNRNNINEDQYNRRSENIMRLPRIKHYYEEYNFVKNYPYKKMNDIAINGGRIDNYYENRVSGDGQYAMSISVAKKVLNKTERNRYHNEGRTRSNYYVEEIEVDENDAVQDENDYYDENDGQREDKYEKVINADTEYIKIPEEE